MDDVSAEKLFDKFEVLSYESNMLKHLRKNLAKMELFYLLGLKMTKSLSSNTLMHGMI